MFLDPKHESNVHILSESLVALFPGECQSHDIIVKCLSSVELLPHNIIQVKEGYPVAHVPPNLKMFYYKSRWTLFFTHNPFPAFGKIATKRSSLGWSS